RGATNNTCSGTWHRTTHSTWHRTWHSTTHNTALRTIFVRAPRPRCNLVFEEQLRLKARPARGSRALGLCRSTAAGSLAVLALCLRHGSERHVERCGAIRGGGRDDLV